MVLCTNVLENLHYKVPVCLAIARRGAISAALDGRRSRMAEGRLPELICKLYALVGELEKEFGRKFTPDGHLVGSIGEVIGARHFGLTLYPPSNEGHGAHTDDGKDVEIKATQGMSVSLRSETDPLSWTHRYLSIFMCPRNPGNSRKAPHAHPHALVLGALGCPAHSARNAFSGSRKTRVRASP